MLRGLINRNHLAIIIKALCCKIKMTQLIEKQICILLRNNFEIWVTGVRLIDDITRKLSNLSMGHTVLTLPKSHNFKQFNTADFVEICTPEEMADRARKKGGDWKCELGSWHKRGERCKCAENAMKPKRLGIIYDIVKEDGSITSMVVTTENYDEEKLKRFLEKHKEAYYKEG